MAISALEPFTTLSAPFKTIPALGDAIVRMTTTTICAEQDPAA